MEIQQTFGLSDIVSNFSTTGAFQKYEELGTGNVNDTYLIFCDSKGEINRYSLQRINHDVFSDPEGLMGNFERVTSHLLKKSIEKNQGEEVLCLIPTLTGKSFYQDGNGNYWRMTKFIAGGRSFEVPQNETHAYEAAKAFGSFQLLLDDLGGPPLQETIPDFHNTRKRFNRFLEVVESDPVGRVKGVSDLIDFAVRHEAFADAIRLEDYPLRVVHNDTKLNNVLLHKTTGRGICVVDLDTVMPGCALHDFGDLVRTAANAAVEDEPDLEKVKFLPERFKVLVEGYLAGCQGMLETKELKKLSEAPIVISFELGIRFLTDYLEGDLYFKTFRPSHNLDRTRSQFALISSMLAMKNEMDQIVNSRI